MAYRRKYGFGSALDQTGDLSGGGSSDQGSLTLGGGGGGTLTLPSDSTIAQQFGLPPAAVSQSPSGQMVIDCTMVDCGALMQGSSVKKPVSTQWFTGITNGSVIAIGAGLFAVVLIVGMKK